MGGSQEIVEEGFEGRNRHQCDAGEMLDDGAKSWFGERPSVVEREQSF